MTELFLLFVVDALLAAALAGLVLHGRGVLSLKVAALGLGATLMLMSWLALTDLLSRPKPIALELHPALIREAEVVSGRIVEDEAIHLWLMPEAGTEPRAYTLPWDRRRAEELQKSLARAGRDGGTVRFRLPSGPSDTRTPVFHPEPPRPSPAKSVPDAIPLRDAARSGGA